MPLAPGQSLSFYEVLGPLGAGGMGEVYRARDTRLEREVAIKVLPEHFAEDEERLRRFEREARTLATLHHPNVASIFGIDQVGEVCFLALELVPGEDLAMRLARGRLPVDEALDVCRQIAEGLEAAHEAGVVHRDLKPANVRITPDGVVKLLDFGLAKPMHPGTKPPGSTTVEPDSFLMTEEGMVLGTPTYMSPEQARGKPVDRRTDVWAFGCVLYECLTGRRVFEGESLTDILAGIVQSEPDWTRLPADVPAEVRALLRRCLDKDARTRLRDIGEARIGLAEARIASRHGAASRTAASPMTSKQAAASSVWLPRLALTAVGLAAGWVLARTMASDAEGNIGEAGPGAPSEATGPTHFDLVLDPPHVLDEIALSPDGRCLVYTARVDGVSQLYARRLDGHTSEAIVGGEGGIAPFFSPDGRQVAFLAAGQLRRVPLEGGVPEVIVAVFGRLTSAFWDEDGTIVYETKAMRAPVRVEARAGGTQSQIPVEGLEPGQMAQSPRPLPGGRTALVTIGDGTDHGKQVAVLDLETGAWKPVTSGEDGRFVAPGHVVYTHKGRVMVIGFDPASGTAIGDAHPSDLLEPALLVRDEIDRFYAATSESLLVYPSGPPSTLSRVLRVSPTGETTPTGLTGVAPRVDSKGRRAVVCPRTKSVHVLDLENRTDTPITFQGTSWYPMWSHDDSFVAFQDIRNVVYGTWTVAPDGSGAPEPLFQDPPPNINSTSVSAEGVWMGYVVDPVTSRDIWVHRPGEGFDMVLATPANERSPALSPKGRLFAYVSDEDGSDQIYLRELTSLERRWQVTTEGGISPVWSRDGRRLYFIRGESILSVDVRIVGGVRIDPETVVLTQPGLDLDPWGNQTFDAMPDGDLLISVAEASEVILRVVVEWKP
jgi:Tol biopolymer transport system component